MWTKDVISGKTHERTVLKPHLWRGSIDVVPKIPSHRPCPTCVKFFGALDLAQQGSEIQFCSSDLAGQTFGWSLRELLIRPGDFQRGHKSLRAGIRRWFGPKRPLPSLGTARIGCLRGS